MKLRIIAVGNRMPAWVDAGFAEYAKRMPRSAALELSEIKPEKRGRNAGNKTAARLLAAERGRIEAVLGTDCYTVALDERGEQLTTAQLAQNVSRWMGSGRDAAFLIGGADGLDAGLKRSAAMLMALSTMTLPHGLARVVLAEQLYRAVSMLGNHPYHRA
ncbi:MAG: 23S rRNA (pseudouridine(1915)-N(3))-methyltransferase RlmH [Burkholderiales bacterium]|nr:23S rRNA (pseudouridine(1915)-N(3))-methyltransferase RlmH [Burkholderiales bacterium]MDQ3195246.1 23S rRNA (pseudouridine(1915)-N(3))-methyltransferase RlmH [Pseudomonadota bacterium]